MNMPSRTRISQSAHGSSFWFKQEVSRVKVEHKLCIMDDFGFLTPVSLYSLRDFYHGE